MEKVLIIDGKECRFKTSASIPRLYRMKFKRDIFSDFTKLEQETKKAKNTGEDLSFKVLEIFENIAYLMHKHGDKNQSNNIDEWLEQFSTFSIYEVLPEIMSLWEEETERFSCEKKHKD